MKIKVDVVSGFLGAGKTTFIKKLISKAYKNERIFVLENEFGRAGIDGEVLKESNIRVKEINSGCICCSPILDFMETLSKEAEEFRPERIIIEPTGVALLSEVISQFTDKAYENLLEMNLIISVVDAKKYDFYMKLRPEFFENQIRAANCVILSRREEVDESGLEKVVEAIRAIKPEVQIITESFEELDTGRLVSSITDEKQETLVRRDLRRLDQVRIISKKIIPRADKAFTSFELEPRGDFSESELYELLQRIKDDAEYGIVLRGKGLVNSKNCGMFKFDYTAGDIKIEKFSAMVKPRICFIGIGLKEKALAELL